MTNSVEGTQSSTVEAPESFVLRARPRPVTRFNRRVVIAVAALVCVVILAATLVALQPMTFRASGEGQELINTERKTQAEGLDTLPRSYSELGPPLAGDVGPPVVSAERDAGIGEGESFRPDAGADAERAERLRLVRQVQQAREAAVFFQVSVKSATPISAPLASERTSPSETSFSSRDPLRPAQIEPVPERTEQGRKLQFLERGNRDAGVNPHRLIPPASPDTVLAGSIISASLVTGINSDLPGFVIAQVTEHVFDTVTGTRLLIPQGTKLIGKYDSVIAFGQQRALVVWNRLILPNGSSIVIENLPATDAAGYAGLEDEVEFHTWQLVKGVALSTLLGVGTELSLGGEESDLVRALRESAQQNTSRAGQQLTERNLGIQPTITIRPGWPLRVIVHKDLNLEPLK